MKISLPGAIKGAGFYKFTSKRQSKKGIMATVLGIVAMVSFIVVLTDSFKAAGRVDTRAGAVGFLSALFALIGLILGLMSLYDKDTFRILPWLGTIVSILSLICWGFVASLGMGLI